MWTIKKAKVLPSAPDAVHASRNPPPGGFLVGVFAANPYSYATHLVQNFVCITRPLSKPGKGIHFLEFVFLPPPQPSPTGEGAVLRQIQITAAVSHMDSYETVAIFAANEFPPPVGEG